MTPRKKVTAAPDSEEITDVMDFSDKWCANQFSRPARASPASDSIQGKCFDVKSPMACDAS